LSDVRGVILPMIARHWKTHWFVHMNPHLRTLAVLLLSLLLAQFSLAQSVSQLSLREVLQVALQRDSVAPEASVSPHYQASAWLAGLPSLGVSYLESNERDGIDETEVSLSLPIKSGRRRDADRVLQSLSAELDELSRLQRELYFSGQIREALWSCQIAEARSRFALEKKQLLQQMEQRQQALLAANASSAYALLMVQKEIVDAEIKQQEYQQEQRQWQLRYRQITGLGSLPELIEEPPIDLGNFSVGQHPKMLSLDAANEQQRQLLLADSSLAADWQVSVNAKNLSAGDYDEDQYGLAVEMPLSFIKMQSQSGNSEWRTAYRQYSLASERLSSELHSRWQLLSGESQTLRTKQTLLARSSRLSTRIEEQLASLLESNEIGQDIALRRMLEAIDTRAAAHTNQLLINQNNAMLRQAAGIPL
jgi:hypothetical protein